MNKVVSVVLLLAFVSGANAEIVTTTDGRKIELNTDGTYKLVETAPKAEIKVTEKEAYFEHFAGEYGQNSMRFMPIFLNETGKTIVGFKFNTVFKSAFGDEVFAFDGESSERIENGKLSKADTFYYFEDNQFMGDEPYDKLKIFKSSSTGVVTSVITAVVFEDGTVLKFTP